MRGILSHFRCPGQHLKFAIPSAVVFVSLSLSFESCLIFDSLGSSQGPVLGHFITLMEG